MTTALTSALLKLMEHEKPIEQLHTAFRDAAWAFERIRDGKLYKAAGHATFEDYCRERWGWTPQHALRLIAAGNVIDIIEESEPTGSLLPTHESQVRDLGSLRDEPELVAEAWSTAVEDADGEQPKRRQVAVAVRKVRQPLPLHKAQPTNAPPHPATFSDTILVEMAELLDGYQRVLDPFAGTGRIHELADHDTVGVELEPEWAAMHQRTHEGSALALPFRDEEFDAITTSPTYGNRLADSYNASDPEARRSYRFDLGHELSPNNSGALQWGPAYREFHEKAWLEALRVLRPGGRFVLDIKDHIRDGKWQDVTGWHVRELTELGLSVCAVRPVVTTGLGGTGSNSSLRTGAELVIGFDKP